MDENIRAGVGMILSETELWSLRIRTRVVWTVFKSLGKGVTLEVLSAANHDFQGSHVDLSCSTANWRSQENRESLEDGWHPPGRSETTQQVLRGRYQVQDRPLHR